MSAAQSLPARLAEAEATIQALLSGEIDAVFDLKSQTPLLLAKAQQAIRDERDHAQRCLDTPDVILMAVDMDARVTLVNRYACDVLGWTPADLIGRNWVETCIPERQRAELIAAFPSALRDEQPLRENLIVTKAGEERLVEWRNTVIRNPDGSPHGIFSSGTDITERTRATRAVEIAEERMRFALEATGVGIWDMDHVTGNLQWSATLERQYGLAVGDGPKTFEAFVQLIHADDRGSVRDTIGAAIKDGSDFAVNHRVVWPDKSVHWISGAGRVVLDAHGHVIRAVGVSQDITERRALEGQFLQAQKMEVFGRLAGGVAHDFNNLLGVILGFCELLIADFPADDQHRADLQQIQNAGLSAARLTSQLLAFSRKEILEPKLLDLNEVVAHMRSILTRLIGEDITILLNLWPERVLVNADRGHLEQVLMNLAVNARDAMPAGGMLTIGTTLAQFANKRDAPNGKPGEYAVLTVEDSGSGMTADTLSRLFEPFFTTKPVGQGTGLGLATVQGIVIRNGGRISVASELAKGTVFTVCLPMSKDDAYVGKPASARAGRRAIETVLVVEDADGLRALTQKLLQRQGYTVLAAADADEAMSLFKAHQEIDVVVTDVVMPGGSGPDLVRRLTELRPHLKVLYVSGYTADAIVHHGVLKTGIAFLHKPFTGETLGAKIREVLGRPDPTLAPTEK